MASMSIQFSKVINFLWLLSIRLIFFTNTIINFSDKNNRLQYDILILIFICVINYLNFRHLYLDSASEKMVIEEDRIVTSDSAGATVDEYMGQEFDELL